MTHLYLTVREVADRARCHPETVRQALRAGDLRGVQRVKNGSWRIRQDAAEAWTEQDENLLEAVAA